MPVAPKRGIVHVVEHEPAARRALTRVLRTAGYEVFSFASAEEFLAGGRADAGPACLVANLSLPGIDGLELQARLEQPGLPLPIVFISGHADVPSVVRAMRGGAIDVLETPVAPQQLLPVLQRAHERDKTRRVLAADRAVLDARLARLTSRERQVFALIVSGLANKCVGAELGTSEKTVKVHRARVMEKMEARSFAELVRLADRLGLDAPEGPQKS